LSIVNNTCSPLVSGSVSATGCGAGTVLEYSINAGGSWSTTAPTYTTSVINVLARCRNTTTNCVSANASGATNPVVCPTCPTLTATTAAAVVVNSTCNASCTVAGGSISAPTTACPTGSTLQYSVNGAAGPWTTTLPTYNQTTAVTVSTRCNCDIDNAISSPIGSVTTVPGTCTTPGTPTLSIVNNTCSPLVSGSVSATGCGAGTVLEYSINAGGSWSTTAPTYTTSVINVLARCRNTTTNCVSANASGATNPVVCPTCPTLTATTAAAVVVNSTCNASCTVAGGSISAPTTACPTGSTLQYSVNGAAGPWTTTLPTYNQTTAVTVSTRCNCDIDNAISSPIGSVTTVPGTCVIPTAFTLTGATNFCTSSGAILSLSGSQTGVSYQLRINGANTGSPIAGTGSAITFPPQSVAGTYTVVNIGSGGCVTPMTGSITTVGVNCDVSISDPCTCKNNATTLNNGQFDDVVTVNGPAGQTWTVTAISGLYATTSPAPPAAPTPILVGSTMTALGGGVYELRGIHIDDLGYTITVSNGITTLSTGNRCFYPNPAIVNIGGPYCVDAPNLTLAATVENNPTATGIPTFVVNGTPINAVFNAATSRWEAPYDITASGTFNVDFVFDAGTAAANNANDPGCESTVKTSFQVGGVSNSVMVCNDLVQVSLDESCQVAITPGMILEGTGTCFDNFNVIITKPPSTNPIPNATVTAAHIGQTLMVSVVNTLDGNSCWGNIHIEDKLPPTLTCNNLTVSCGMTDYSPQAIAQVGIIQAFPNNIPFPNTNITVTGANSFNIAQPLAHIFENCTTVSLTYSDTYTDVACAPYFGQDISAIVIRDWTAVDASGNIGTCQQTIYFARKHLADVNFPMDIQLSCSNPTSAGVPTIGIGTGTFPLYPNNSFCELNTTFNDDTIQICAGSYKILRTWVLYDWCLPTTVGTNPFYKLQVIKFLDTAAPEIVTAGFCNSVFVANTNPNDCESDFNLPDFVAKDVCAAGLQSARAEWSINNVVFGINGTISNTTNAWSSEKNITFGIANNLPLGTTIVTYILTDKCGNSATCTITVNVEDNIPPVTICTEVTQVAIGYGDGVTCGSGNIDVPANSFDQGSYDNCAPVYFKVRRMDNNSCDANANFKDNVRFCCSDVGNTVTVILRVYDRPTPAGNVSLDSLEGHYNDCMIQVLVEDKIKPVCTAPANVTVSCEAFDPSFWAYGAPTAYDNCCGATCPTPEALSPDVSNWDATCNRGTYIRRWRATDCNGNVGAICSQRIVVNYVQDYQVKWPNDMDVTNCDGVATFGEPIITGKDCELTAVSYEDQVYTIVNDACRKIERTWTIINWCSYDANADCIQVNNPNASTTGPTIRISDASGVDLLPNAPSLAGAVDISAFSNRCITYKQIIKINDAVAPIADEPIATECDYSANNENLWNDAAWYDAAHFSHDLCEGGEEISITANDDCSKTDVNIRALLFMDLDNNGVMETVFNTNDLNPPARGSVWVNNATALNFAGTTALQFDKRPNLTSNQRYSLGLELSTVGTKRKASLRFRTLTPDAWSNPQLPYGNYKIKWIISDGCGNEVVKEKLFTIKDCKKPTVVCRNGLSVNLMNNPGNQGVTLWASDFLQYGEDNCTPPIIEPYNVVNIPADQLAYAIVKTGTPEDNGTFPLNPNGTPRTSVNFDCANVGVATTVKLYSKDKAGNFDFCEAFISVQDNMNVCPGISPYATVAGTLKTETLDGLQDAAVNLNSTHPVLPPVNMVLTSSTVGGYSFSAAISLASNATITPLKNDNPLNGVTTYDLLLISKHILGVAPLNTPYKMIAADVNKSGSITTFDIVELRKLILGIYNDFPSNKSWRFVDKSFIFADPNNPFALPFPEQRTFFDLQQSSFDNNFVSVKIGDVNGNATANNLMASEERNTGTLLFDVTDRKVKSGEVFTVDFKAAERLLGYQFTLKYGSNLEVMEILPGEKMDRGNFAVFADKNALTTSFDGATQAEFGVTFRAKSEGQLSKFLNISSEITTAQSYGLDASLNEVALRFNGEMGTTIAGQAFEIYQNTPNPFINKTTIGFYLPTATEATLTVFDEVGRTVLLQKGDFAKGYNAFNIDLDAKGVLMYKIETATDSAVRKMIQVK
jgi:hypothetical protein